MELQKEQKTSAYRKTHKLACMGQGPCYPTHHGMHGSGSLLPHTSWHAWVRVLVTNLQVNNVYIRSLLHVKDIYKKKRQ